MPDSKPWFIHDQRWSVLTATSDRKKYLDPEVLRYGRVTRLDVNELDQAWRTLPSWDDLAMGSTHVVDDLGQPISLHRVIITSDAGIGKTKATEWLDHRINHPSTTSASSVMAFRFDVRTFLDGRQVTEFSVADQLIDELTDRWVKACEQQGTDANPTHFRAHLDSAARRGEICLLMDGLDQASEDDWKPIFWLLNSVKFKPCRFILAGRSNVIWLSLIHI